jgi:phosphopentomutase
LDGAGVGALPDAEQFGDQGSNTLGHVIRQNKGIRIPNLISLGLKKILTEKYFAKITAPEKILGAHGKMAELSPGKDTTTGHWELAGLVQKDPFPLYPQGFPPAIISSFEKITGRGVLGNIPYSGTEIIKKFGEKHLQTGCPIVYTSADSVFQVAAHQDVVPLDTLYAWCSKAREKIFVGKHALGRVIARPFEGVPGNFVRSAAGRRDYSLPPPGPTILSLALESGHQVWTVGKVSDIFAGKNITRHLPATGNQNIMQVINDALQENFTGILWANLVDFDMLYGHRNDPRGFARALEEFDLFLGRALHLLRKGDLLAITADHGCDPTFKGTDHTREYVPLLIYSPDITAIDLGTRKSFADLGATVAQLLGCKPTVDGQSFAGKLFREGSERQ